MKEKSKNRELREEFYDYCVTHPELRFWQALRDWSGHHYVLVADDEPDDWNKARDTFYFEGKNE